jgi:hypothetical protein
MNKRITDTDRLNWLEKEIRQNGTVEFKGNDIFSVSSQWVKNAKDIRERIDSAIERSNERLIKDHIRRLKS